MSAISRCPLWSFVRRGLLSAYPIVHAPSVQLLISLTLSFLLSFYLSIFLSLSLSTYPSIYLTYLAANRFIQIYVFPSVWSSESHLQVWSSSKWSQVSLNHYNIKYVLKSISSRYNPRNIPPDMLDFYVVWPFLLHTFENIFGRFMKIHCTYIPGPSCTCKYYKGRRQKSDSYFFW